MDNLSENKADSENAGSTDHPKIIKVIEEFATIDSQLVETGKVRITKTVINEDSALYVPIINESYRVEHVQVPSRIFDELPTVLTQEGDTTVIKVLREFSVVIKKFELIEEIHITREVTQTPLTHEITLRKEKVHIERIDSNPSDVVS